MKLPKLHLRDLFWLVLVVACLCGWWLQYQRTALWEWRANSLKSALEVNRQGKITFDQSGFSFYKGENDWHRWDRKRY